MLFSSWAYSPMAAEWPGFRGNPERTGFYSRAVGVPEKNAEPQWKIKLPGAVISSPAIENGYVYIGARDSSVYCLDAKTGEVIWKVKTGGWVDSSPTIHKDIVYVGSRDGYLYALDKKSGDVINKYPAGLQLSSPAVYNDESVITGLGPPVNGVSSFPLRARSTKIVDTVWSQPLPQMSYSSPALSRNIMVIGASNGKMYGKDASTGENLWDIQTQGGVYLSTPSIDDSVVYFSPGNLDQNIYVNRLENGEELRKVSIGGPQGSVPSGYLRKTGAGPKYIHPHVFKQLLRLSPEDRQMYMDQLNSEGYKLNKLSAKGPEEESYKWIPIGGMKTSSVAVGPNNAYVIQKYLGFLETSPNQFDYRPYFILTSVDKSKGKQSWQFHKVLDSERLGYASSPIVSNYLKGGQVVFFGWGEGRVYALHDDKGKSEPQILWEDKLQGHVISSPALADGQLYFATTEGYVYAYPVAVAANPAALKEGVYAYPNPVRKRATEVNINFDLSGSTADVSLVVYNTAERPVFRDNFRVNTVMSYSWKLKGVANGVYFAKVVVDYDSGGSDSKWIKIAVLRE